MLRPDLRPAYSIGRCLRTSLIGRTSGAPGSLTLALMIYNLYSFFQ